MKKIIIASLLFFTAISIAQEQPNFKELDYRLNGSFGMSFNSDWFMNIPSLYVKTGFGFKFKEDFWLNADVFNMRYGTDRDSSDERFYTNWTLAPNLSRDFNITEKLKLIGSAGLMFTYETFSDDFSVTSTNSLGEIIRRRFFKESSRFEAGAIVGLKALYAIKENFLVGIDFTVFAYYYMPLENFLLGPTIEFRL